MAAKAKKTKTIDKWRKKKFFSVLAPKLFQERELGQSIAYEPGSLQNRLIKSNLMVLTGNIKKQDINITFKVKDIKGDTAYTIFEKYEITPSAIKRRIKRQRNRIDESFDCITKDNKIFRIKPLIITRGKASRSVVSALRKNLMHYFVSSIKKIDRDTLIMDVIHDKIQKDISHRVGKVFPLRFVNIRVLKYVGEHTPADDISAENAPEQKPAPKELTKTSAKKESEEKAKVENFPEAENKKQGSGKETVEETVQKKQEEPAEA